MVNLAADGNKNGTVDAADYTIWRNDLGPDIGDGSVLLVGVPEPGTSFLALIAAAIALSSWRRSWLSV
jgi:hypothetical protein